MKSEVKNKLSKEELFWENMKYPFHELEQANAIKMSQCFALREEGDTLYIEFKDECPDAIRDAIWNQVQRYKNQYLAFHIEYISSKYTYPLNVRRKISEE